MAACWVSQRTSWPPCARRRSSEQREATVQSAMSTSGGASQNAAPTLGSAAPLVPAPRWEQTASYPDPAVRTLDPRFDTIKPPFNAAVERLATGFRWAEGPVWFGDGRYLLWSDIPNNRIM